MWSHATPTASFATFMRSLQRDTGEDSDDGEGRSAEGTRRRYQYYLNVQNLKAAGQLLPDLLHRFKGDFSAPTALMGALKLHEVNLWLGDVGAQAASTSPLHYDPFDNVYALLRGRKVVLGVAAACPSLSLCFVLCRCGSSPACACAAFLRRGCDVAASAAVLLLGGTAGGGTAAMPPDISPVLSR